MRFALVLAACSSAAPRPAPVANQVPPPVDPAPAPAPAPANLVLDALGITDDTHVAKAIALARVAQGHCDGDVADTDRQTLHCSYQGTGDDAITCRGAAALLVVQHVGEFLQPVDLLFSCHPVGQHATFDMATRTLTVEGDDGESVSVPAPAID